MTRSPTNIHKRIGNSYVFLGRLFLFFLSFQYGCTDRELFECALIFLRDERWLYTTFANKLILGPITFKSIIVNCGKLPHQLHDVGFKSFPENKIYLHVLHHWLSYSNSSIYYIISCFTLLYFTLLHVTLLYFIPCYKNEILTVYQ